MKKMTEAEAKNRVRQLKRFYTDIVIYALVNMGLILVWIIFGGGYFWPIFVIIGWGIGLGLQAFSLGMIPMVAIEVFPFLGKNWEEKQVSKILKCVEFKRKKSEEISNVNPDKFKER